MSRHIAQLILIGVLILSVISINAQSDTPILDRIIERDALICGVNGTLPGFGQDIDGGYSGFDVDICKAVAVAILEDASKVIYVPLVAGERKAALVDQTVDMLSRNTTFTLTRDVSWNAIFGPVVFYDGQGVIVFRESGISTLELLSGGSICVAGGTTTEANIKQEMELRGLTADYVVVDSTQRAVDTFLTGRCDAYTGDLSALVVQKGLAENPESLTILDIQPISKEPLAPVSPSDDSKFANIVRWVVFGLISAEELGITSQNVEALADGPNANIQHFLGKSGAPIGDVLGIKNDFMIDVLLAVGNYGEIYDRHLGTDSIFRLPRGQNDLWLNGGLLYSPPFR